MTAAPHPELEPPDWPTPPLFGESLLALSDEVSVLPSEVAAVTAAPKQPHFAAVYLRGSGGRSYLYVRKSMHEVVQLLEDARGSAPPF